MDSLIEGNITFPKLSFTPISKENDLDSIEEKLDKANSLIVIGEKGCGLTTELALFVQRHQENSISFFNNELRYDYCNSNFIEDVIKLQLYIYAYKHKPMKEELSCNSLEILAFQASKRAKKSNQIIYFVFDGFDAISEVKKDGVIFVLNKIFRNKDRFRYVFSSRKERLNNIHSFVDRDTEAWEMSKISNNEVVEYLKGYCDSLTSDQLNALKTIICRSGERLQYVTMDNSNPEEHIRKILTHLNVIKEDIYTIEGDIIDSIDNQGRCGTLLAIVAISEIPLKSDVIIKMVNSNEAEFKLLMQKLDRYLITDESGFIVYKFKHMHLYCRSKFDYMRNDIELLLLKQFENNDIFVPELMPLYNKHKPEMILKLLSPENINKMLDEGKSQASVNEQCIYGYKASTQEETAYAERFRFAVNKSVSLEIERNVLWDYEIDALLSLERWEEAIVYANSIYLVEEKFKSLIAIASYKKLPDDIKKSVVDEIHSLMDIINFESIPDKSIELAKALMPIAFRDALEIIERISKIDKGRIDWDRLYTVLYMTMYDDVSDDRDNVIDYEELKSRISDDSVRKFVDVMKSAFGNITVEEVKEKMNLLSSNTQKIIFLNYWIPLNKKAPGISDLILYAIQLTIEDSNMEMPKLSSLLNYSKALKYISEDEPQKEIVEKINGILSTLKSPFQIYIDIKVELAKVAYIYSKEDGCNLIIDLYLELYDVDDMALRATGLSKILSLYENSGMKKDFEEQLCTANKMLDEIMLIIGEEIKRTAYHYKLIEGSLKALVCDYPTFVKTIIPLMNSLDRRSRAFKLAATEYVKHKPLNKIDWTYLCYMIDSINFDVSDRFYPLNMFVQRLKGIKDSTLQANDVKRLDKYIDDIDNDSDLVVIIMYLYLWFTKYYHSDSYTVKLKDKLRNKWKGISIAKVKIDVGYYLVKELCDNGERNLALSFMTEIEDIKSDSLLSSASNMTAYFNSFEIYSRAMVRMIQIDINAENKLKDVNKLFDTADSTGISVLFWSKIALAYYTHNDIGKMGNIATEYILPSLDSRDISMQYHKMILFHCGPVLFLTCSEKYFSELEKFDPYFKVVCIDNIAKFLFTKNPFTEKWNENTNCYNITFKDVEYLIDLMKHNEDDNTLYCVVDRVCSSIKDNNTQISKQMYVSIIDAFKKIAEDKLPSKTGLQHDGYKIGIMIALECLKTNPDWTKFKSEIDNINNEADRSFLLNQLACYTKNKTTAGRLLEESYTICQGLNLHYDKYVRMNMLLTISLSVSKEKFNQYFPKMIKQLKEDKDAGFSFSETLVDLAIQSDDERYINSVVEMFDDDPSRLHYKRMLCLKDASRKRIEQAEKDLTKVSILKNVDCASFFSTKLSEITSQKGIVTKIDKFSGVFDFIMTNNISETKNAMSYFIENLYRSADKKQKRSKEILDSICNYLFHNIQLVLSLSVGSADNLKRISRSFVASTGNGTFIRPGERSKAISLIIEWYKKHPFGLLYIVDAYFNPEDLNLIKNILDINNDIQVRILTHKQKWEGSDYKTYWSQQFAKPQSYIEITQLCYQENMANGPLHDRYTVVYDEDTKNYYGIKGNSLSSYGNKECDIEEMSDNQIEGFKSIINDYCLSKIRLIDGKKLAYNVVTIN